MPTTKSLLVKDLSLDLHNFRTRPQKSEVKAIEALISIKPTWFWALMESLLEGPYHVTETIIVWQKGSVLTVREGNRRIAALKLIHGFIPHQKFELPSHLRASIAAVDQKWRTENAQVPCVIYTQGEDETVDRVISLAHGKGQRAARDAWTAVARARHNRDVIHVDEPYLNLLESYLKHGKNLTIDQKQRWAGDYPLTVVEEVMKRLAPRLQAASAADLAASYPKKISHRAAIEEILRDVGLEELGFPRLRDKVKPDFALSYGLPGPVPAAASSGSAGGAGGTGGNTGGTGGTGSGGGAGTTTGTGTGGKTAAHATSEPKSVINTLKQWKPAGNGRDKVVALRNEAVLLKIDRTPIAFCFILRSMFELSAKAYCADHAAAGLSSKKPNKEDKALVQVLREITGHLTNNNTDAAVKKTLHGALVELAQPDGFLSVASLNQLVHSQNFSVDERHICGLFSRIFPLLEAMNS